MEENIKHSLMRKDSGELRLFISLLFVLTAGFFGWIGYDLIKAGVASLNDSIDDNHYRLMNRLEFNF